MHVLKGKGFVCFFSDVSFASLIFKVESINKISLKITFSPREKCGVSCLCSHRTELCKQDFSLLPGEMNVLKFHLFAYFHLSRYRLYGRSQISCVIKDKGVDWDGNLPLCDSK